MIEMVRAAALLLAFAATPALAQTPACQIDGQIAPQTRAGIEAAALKAAGVLLGDNPGGVLPLMTQAMQAKATADMFATQVRIFTQAGAPFSKPHIGHSYFLPGKGSQTRLTCGAGMDAVDVAVRPGTGQAQVLVVAESRNNGWTISETLLPEHDAWRLSFFHIGVTGMAGRDARTLLTLAHTERDAGHLFNATLLYNALAGLTDLGSDIELATRPRIKAEFDALARPPELQGAAPFAWTLNGKHYTVTGASLIGIGTDIGIVFDLPQSDWPGQDQVAARNREFLDAFRAAHPDYARVFGFLVARAHKPDNSGGFSTVYENGKGYD